MKKIICLLWLFQSTLLIGQNWYSKIEGKHPILNTEKPFLFSVNTTKSDVALNINYIPVVTPANEWVADYWWDPWNPTFPYLRRYTFSTDSTLIARKYYRELIYSENMNGGPWLPTNQFLRENNGKVYKIWPTSNQPERLIYDMDFGVGDTLAPDPNLLGQGDRKIVQVGTIALLDGIPRKWLKLESTLCNYSTTWIEGMGDVERLFWSEVFCSLGEDGPQIIIRCFSTNGQLLYKRGDVEGCYTSAASEAPIALMNVYPNPASEALILALDDPNLLKEVRIFNALGSRVLEHQGVLQEGILDVSSLPNGFYTGIARLTNGAQRSFKFIVNK